MAKLPFIKMHGLGNDFVVLDARLRPLDLTPAQTQAIANRRLGVGCDQVIVIEPPRNKGADVFMRIRNADGGEAAACGNAARCVAALIMREKNIKAMVIETPAGLLCASDLGDGSGGGLIKVDMIKVDMIKVDMIKVDMGPARLQWQDIPLAKACDTLHLDLRAGPFSDPAAVGMGNPHAVFFVDDAEAAPVAALGPVVARHPMFPDGVNVGFAQVILPQDAKLPKIRLRVWERGAGLTAACGSGACAAVVAASRRGLIAGRAAEVILDGGSLLISWAEDNHVLMSGPAAVSFTGEISDALFGDSPA